jgi:hypothetical protein
MPFRNLNINTELADKTLNRRAISAGEVATYIKMGRQRVAGSEHDPYAKLKDPTPRMMKDAMTIAQWFNSNRAKWGSVHYQTVLKDIQDIQYGPALYWKKVLQEELTPTQMKAAESWALRHNAGDYVDVGLAPEVRDRVFGALDTKLKLRKTEEPIRSMLDTLRFAFCGLMKDERGDALDL